MKKILVIAMMIMTVTSLLVSTALAGPGHGGGYITMLRLMR